ncbi:hypothetical protein PV325_008822 [Microctonus aethiopoides]|nr:hypothetical protein PV325_008822 [Microctonus aethiopoides]
MLCGLGAQLEKLKYFKNWPIYSTLNHATIQKGSYVRGTNENKSGNKRVLTKRANTMVPLFFQLHEFGCQVHNGQELQDTSESLPSKGSSSSLSQKSSSEKFENLIQHQVTINGKTVTPQESQDKSESLPSKGSSSILFSRTSPLPSPHLDKHFFDSSLIEMKSQASSSSTLDYDSTDEEILKLLVDFVQKRKRRIEASLYQKFDFPYG